MRSERRNPLQRPESPIHEEPGVLQTEAPGTFIVPEASL